MKTILFYSSISNKTLFKTQKFYQIDIDILQSLGYTIILSNKISDALLFWKYDILFAYFYRKSFFAALFAKICRKSIYFTGGIDDLDKAYASKVKYYIQKVFFNLCYYISTSCIIVSRSDYNNVVQNLWSQNRNKLSYSEHTIDTSKFVDISMDREPMFSTIVWQGVVENIKRKGVDKSLHLFSRIIKNADFEKYKFIIMGKTGKGTEYIDELIQKYGIQDSVVITGEVSEEDKIAILMNSQFYFQLSEYEGFGIAALEALCAGNIVIHSGKGGLSNSIYNVNGLLFDIDNEFMLEFDKLMKCIRSNKMNYNHIQQIRMQYDNARRLKDFKNIITQ